LSKGSFSVQSNYSVESSKSLNSFLLKILILSLGFLSYWERAKLVLC